MARITPQETAALARLSRLAITAKEAEQFTHELEAVFTYASVLAQKAPEYAHLLHNSHAQKNIWRDDVCQNRDQEAILKGAPLVEDNYFVVPAIVKKK